MVWRALLIGAAAALSSIGMVSAPRAAQPAYVAIPGGAIDSVLPPAAGQKRATVRAFKLERTPVTNADFARFLRSHPEWRRDRASRLFVDGRYLSHWPSAAMPAAVDDAKPVVNVSWFAASAYCESHGARLPTWYEWEYVAAASENKADARGDANWLQKVLGWYSQSGRGPLPAVGLGSVNYYGVQDMHGIVWEWTDDFSGIMVSADNREQGDPDALRFCGTGALSLEQKENYATLMRVAMLSSLKAPYTMATLGFRCAMDGVR